jgi:predicted CoA-binding protein
MQENIESLTAKFLAAKIFAVVGASRDRSKYGNKVFQALVESGRTVYPLNPSAPEIEGQTAYATIADLPVVPESLSIVTPPQVTREVIQHAVAAGVKNIWMQPGAEDDQASKINQAESLGYHCVSRSHRHSQFFSSQQIFVHWF